MAYEQRDNSASLFKNDNRETEQQPHLKGSAMIDGQEYWVSAWSRVTKTGDKWLSLAFTRKEQQAKPAGKKGGDPWDDDLGF